MGTIDLQRVQKRRKLAIAAILATAVVLILFTHSRALSESGWHEAIDILGAAAIVLCILGRTWSSIYIAGSKRVRVVDTGPYSLTRNPLYVFSVIGALGVGLTTGSVVLGAALGLVTFLVFHMVILSEETFLRTQFGGDYADYAARVPRWLPKFSAWRGEEWVRTRPANILITFRDSCLFLLAVPAFEGIEYLQDIGTLPVLLVLP